MSTFQAKQAKKRWCEWASRNLASRVQCDVVETVNVLARLRSLEALHSVSLSYEVVDATFDAACMAIRRAIETTGVQLTVAIVGDSKDPAVLRLQNGDLNSLLLEVANADELVCLASTALDGVLVIEVPALLPHGDFMIVGKGSLEFLVTEVQRILPGGTVFRGN